MAEKFNYLDKAGLTWLINKVKGGLAGKVDKETGKGLSANDYTNEEKAKLADIQAKAQVNTIEGIKVNGVAMEIGADKSVNLTVGDAGEVNLINAIKVNGTTIEPDTNKAVDISVPTMDEINGIADKKVAIAQGATAKGKVATTDSSGNVVFVEELSSFAKKADIEDFVSQEAGKGLSSNDYTNADKEKVASVETGAQVNVIEAVTVDGKALSVADKKVNIDLTCKVDKETGKGLSTNDYTTLEKNKLNGIAEGAQANVIEGIKVNGTAVSLADKVASLTIPTSTEIDGKIDAKIADAVADITSFEMEVVAALPTSGVKGTIYLVAHTHGSGDSYDEYIWTGSAFEKIGNTDIDLSAYAKTADFEAITTAELEAAWGE